MNRILAASIGAVGAFLVGAALAQDPPRVPWLCGGVGEDEQRDMKARAGGYDLMLTFATPRGAYVADVDVDIRDSQGRTVLQARCGSPIMLVDLPGAGRYRVSATAQGQTRHAAVAVANGTASVTFTWPVP